MGSDSLIAKIDANGIDNLLRMRLRVDWDHEGYEGVTQNTIKKYNAQIHTQSAIHCMIQLAAANKPRLDVASGFDPGTIASIEAEVPQITYDFTGGGQYGSETDVRTKEQADHESLRSRGVLAVGSGDGHLPELPPAGHHARWFRPPRPSALCLPSLSSRLHSRFQQRLLGLALAA